MISLGGQLIAYYSRRGQNFVGGGFRELEVGNTELAAEMLRVLTRADIFPIEPARDYDPDFCRCMDQARQDLLRGIRLELKRWPENWDGYDTVYLGYPNHWGTLPVAVFSFLEKLDFTGKTLYPFCIYEWGGLGRSIDDLRRTCPTARIGPSLLLRGEDIRQELYALVDWIEEKDAAKNNV